MIRRVEDCRKKAMECHHRAFACQDHAIRVLYLDLVYQWRQIADEFEVLERAKLKGPTSGLKTILRPTDRPSTCTIGNAG